ncbi:Aste57867_21697 [Aphanomyces stellatus]|uniref:Aste57867_21697 protein n=1 Tax=Aphanomyces stellatus TaxID=120398 RepID=A0A485LI76_9STRA|nr:hypothetical protein As57867_021628 [Aphanomyces stellatus]VFT98366.1 Aste57867_21697 [Aphanomyces stellatus]
MFAGGLKRLGLVTTRIPKSFSGNTLDKLISDGIVDPPSASSAWCIMSTACAPASDVACIDLRDFHAGAKHAMQTSLGHFFSPAMMDIVSKSDVGATCEANEYLRDVSSSCMYDSILKGTRKLARNNERIVPQSIDKFAIAHARFDKDEADHEFVEFIVSCKVSYEKIATVENDDTSSNSRGGDAAATDEATIRLPKMHVMATFKSFVPPSGELDWTLDRMRVSGKAFLDSAR